MVLKWEWQLAIRVIFVIRFLNLLVMVAKCLHSLSRPFTSSQGHSNRKHLLK